MSDRLPSPLATLKPLAGRALELALNRLLALDPDTRDALAGLDGRRIALAMETPPLALEIRVDERALRVGPVRQEVEPDLSVRATLAGLIGQLPFLRDDQAPPVGKLRMAGDADLARRLQKLAQGFAPDWDAPFVEVLGDVLGVQIARALRGAFLAGLGGAKSLARDTAEYLTEESRDVVSRFELDRFHDEVDGVREHADRLAVRVGRLLARVTERGA